MLPKTLLARHPIVRNALAWAVPALLVGGILRILLISYLPYAFWGADTASHYSFAHRLLVHHDFSLDEKRRFLYPLLMVPISLLPGVPMVWVAALQHLFGEVSLVALAYIIRKSLGQWRWWIIPITLLYAVLPVIVLFEHEMVGECLLFNAFLWAFAGWQAWVTQKDANRARKMFWWFYVPFAAFILTKPSARFAWPALFVAFLFLPNLRRTLSRWQAGAFIALILITPMVGSKKLGSSMLYTATFPLTRLDSPRHAEYKAEIRGMVEELQPHLDVYYLLDDVPFNLIFRGEGTESRPKWKALSAQYQKQRAPIYLDLAVEGIKSRPREFLYFGVQRLIASANLSFSDWVQFTGGYYRDRERLYYEKGQQEQSAFRLAAGLPMRGELPPYEEFVTRLEPVRDSWRASFVQAVIRQAARFDLVVMPKRPIFEQRITRARPTLAGWMFLIGAGLSFTPRYRRTLGVWTLLSVSYLYGVFVFSEVNYRFFAPAWPVILVLMAIPADFVLSQLIVAIQARSHRVKPQFNRPAVRAAGAAN